jgi:3-methyl-2-oxobutanoate hydroxymethyltransferase
MKITPQTLKDKKESGEKLVVLSVPDFYSARLADESGVQCLIVGDSLGRFLHGDEDAFSVSTGDIAYYSRIIRRATKNALVIADMPYSGYMLGSNEAIDCARHLIKYGEAEAVKLEGGRDYIATVGAIVDSGISVMGHLGLKNSFQQKLGGLPLTEQQRNKDWDNILEYAEQLEKKGIFSLLLECVPAELGKIVAKTLKIPVIGLGAGRYVDGQSMIFHDMMSFHEGFKPKYVKKYARLSQIMNNAVKEFIEEVNNRKFPASEHEY